jgi:membrane dipeptidase
MSEKAQAVHRDAIVIDAVSPLLDDPSFIDWYVEGGVTVASPTVGGWEPSGSTFANLGRWCRFLKSRADIVLVRTSRDVLKAKQDGKIGVFFHLQGADPVESDLNLVDVYKLLGVGVIQLCYNVRNRVGDGCEEPDNAGLSRFGRDLVKRLNETKVVVDCSHTGLRTSLEAVEVSSAPVILSHANAHAVHPSGRNVADELIKAIAGSGGVIGANGFPAFVSASNKPSLDQMIAHIDHIVQLVGIDHASLGVDYYWAQAGVMEDADALKVYRKLNDSGLWSSENYPPPPHYYPTGVETPKQFEGFTEGLLRLGYSADDTRKVLGENWLRVMRAVWD